jgi:hypothetical protein
VKELAQPSGGEGLAEKKSRDSLLEQMVKYPLGVVFRIPQRGQTIRRGDSRSDEEMYEALSKVEDFMHLHFSASQQNRPQCKTSRAIANKLNRQTN